MAIRKSSLLFIALVLFFSLAVPVQASPNQQDPQDDLIRQVLTATATDLGWDTSVKYNVPQKTGIPIWYVSGSDMFADIVDVRAYNSASAAQVALHETVTQVGSQFLYHGYPALHAATEYTAAYLLQADRFVIEGFSLSEENAKRNLDAFYQHAVAFGLFAGDGSSDPTPTETLSPTQAVTPQPGAPITLQAFSENYNPATQVIDNSANFATVAISGSVTDLNTGAPIAGATIEITGGAAYGSCLSASDGSYSLTAVIASGQDSGQVSGIDFALPVKADLTIEVIPVITELVADGSSTSAITVYVKDLQGNPLPGRDLSLVLDADAGPGTIHTAQTTTNDKGVIEATYTAFIVDPDQTFSSPRHEVTIFARDNTTGFSGSTTIFVNQYQLTVQYDEFIPACIQCNFPSKFTISVFDYWNNPIPNAQLYLEIIGLTSDGTLVLDPKSNENQQEIILTTDINGRTSVFFKWQGSLDIAEAIRQVVIVEETTNAKETKDVNVHGLDIGISRVEEAGFTGVTGQQAFLKIYFKERAHPDLLPDRFNINSPNRLGMHVTINQFQSDGANTSLTYDQTGGWEQDEKGLYVKMYTTPHMPYIIPENDGTSWYEVRVDPIIDQDVLLPDLFRANNDTIIALETGSPEGWMHIWLKDGVLTPQNYLGVMVKCVLRFMPGFSQTLTVIDTLNQVYNTDVLGLSQSTSQVLTDELQLRIGKTSPSALTKLKASALNNVVSCAQDAYGVYKQGSVPNPTCAKLATLSPRFVTAAREETIDPEIYQFQVDQFVHGFLMNDPNQQALILSGLTGKDFQLLNANGQAIDVSETISAENGMVVILYSAKDGQSIRVSAHTPFDIAMYQAGPDATRQTLHFNVKVEDPIIASLNLSGASDTVLNIDKNGDAVADETLAPTLAIHDITRPVITDLQPTDGALLGGKSLTMTVAYMDESGIAPDLVRIWLDDIEMSLDASATTQEISLQVKDVPAGEHHAHVEVSDLAGNKSAADWYFTVKEPTLLEMYDIPLGWVIAVGIGVLLLIVGFGLALILIIARKRNQPEPVQDARGNWRYDDPKTGIHLLWNGQNWQPTPGSAARVAPARRSGFSCLLVLLTSGLIAMLVVGGISLVAFDFFPKLQITPGQGDLIQSLKMGGGGLLVTILGLLLLYGGFRSILTKRAVITDESGRRREKGGFGAILIGLGQLFFGLVLLAGGLGWLSLVFYQDILPLMGF